ncbi:MAG: phosphate signaling complex protein PhoU [Planctomycetes bacterium]|jgi:phosphate transport system protein|nr:phosphate signaling complex protein PhoU [Planctomycetota bacterium]
MRRHFEREIENLKQELFLMGNQVERAIGKAAEGLFDRNPKSAEEVVRQDGEIDERELRIEEECLKVLALYNPVASDLRFIIAVVKINNDLERMGDLAVNMAERALYLIERPPLDPPGDVRRICDLVRRMVKVALDSLVKGDAEMALQVGREDDEVDGLHREFFHVVQEEMTRAPDRIDRLLPYLSASRYLERIADHATNIAEDVYYLARGDIIRHHAKEYARQAGLLKENKP